MIKLVYILCFTMTSSCALVGLATEKKSNMFRERIIWLAKEKSLNGEIIRNVAKENGLTEDEMFKETESIVQNFRRLSEDFSAGSTDSQRNTDAYWCLTMIQVLSRDFGSKFLPLFEDMATSSNDMVRFNGYTAYVRVAGVDSIDFLEKSLASNLYTPLDRSRIYKTFGKKLMNDKSQLPVETIKNAHIFLLKQAEIETGAVEALDTVLCENLEEWKTSIQRHEFMNRFSKSDNEYRKNRCMTIRAKIEKTPKENHKDFNARGELLDPDRGK